MERASSLGSHNLAPAGALDRSQSVGSQGLAAEAGTAPACPSFLQPLASSILAAGTDKGWLMNSGLACVLYCTSNIYCKLTTDWKHLKLGLVARRKGKGRLTRNC